MMDYGKTVCEAHGRKRKAVGKPLSLVGVTALQQRHHSTQCAGQPRTLGCSVTRSYPLLWVTASASPQRREMHVGKQRQDNRELSKSQQG